jgi:hypothetical protein
MRHHWRMAGTVSNRMVVPLTAFVAGGILSLLLGVYGAQHEPTHKPITTFGFDTMFEMKVVLAIAVGVLALLQVVGALWLYGKLGIEAPSWLGMAHRASGTLAILISLPVAFHCLWSLGFQSDGNVPNRVLVHSIAGCAVYGALVVKVVAVRTRSAPGWLLPVAGGLLFAAIVIVVWTSAVWYVGENGWHYH